MLVAGSQQAERLPRVLCTQIGARDHYAFARAFYCMGALSALATDYWHRSDAGWMSRLTPHISGRRHPALDSARVIAPNFRTLLAEAAYRMPGRSHWGRILARNARFQGFAAQCVSSLAEAGGASTLFAYSYAAELPLAAARERGWVSLLGQIDPGPAEYGIIRDLAAKWPEFRQTRDCPPEGYFDAWRKELELSDRVIVNSSWSLNCLLSEGVAPGKLVELPIPYECPSGVVPHEEIPSSFSRSRPLRLLFLGQVNLRKGIAELLHAMRDVRDLPVELRVVGEEQVEIPAALRALPNVRWMGFSPRSAAIQHFHAADLFILPTHSDGFGLTQLEALSSGLPVVVSKNCAGIVDHDVNGWLLPEVTPVAVADCLRMVLDTSDLLPRWSAACRIPPHCTFKAVSAKLRGILRSDV